MASTTMRINKETWEVLRELSEQRKEPMQKVLAKAVEAYRRRHILESANAAYAALQTSPEDWREEEQERRAWDATLADGLEQA